MVSYLSGMKAWTYISLVALVLTACETQPSGNTAEKTDSTVLPDSVPRVVRIGKEADWAYKPDTMMNELLLGDSYSLKNYTKDNGGAGRSESEYALMTYVNSGETEQMTVFVTNENNKAIPFGFRVKKNIRDKNSPPAENYATAAHFISGSGVYLGMSEEYVQTIYKSQPMKQWIKNDTTYLVYTPSEKDKEHYHTYSYTDYSALYKFVNDQLVMMEMFVDKKAFKQQ